MVLFPMISELSQILSGIESSPKTRMMIDGHLAFPSQKSERSLNLTPDTLITVA